jgi:hypothetical protein
VTRTFDSALSFTTGFPFPSIVSCSALLDFSAFPLASSAFALAARAPRFRGEAILRGLGCFAFKTAGDAERFGRGISGAGSMSDAATNLGGVAILLLSLSLGPISIGEGSRSARIHARMAYSSARFRAADASAQLRGSRSVE